MFAFSAMNTEVRVVSPPDEAAVASRVARTFADAELRFSRFREDSELSALNRASGPFVASAELFEVLERARDYVELTQGLFDPGVGATLEALGYDRSFEPGALDRSAATQAPPASRFLDVILEAETRTVWRPQPLKIDLGGLVKGRTVDRAARHLTTAGVIDAGGDARLLGAAPNGEPWLVDVEDPRDASRILASVAATDVAVATSATNRRRWRVGNTSVHHLVDPRTQRPSTSDLHQATVFAPTAELADVLAKTALLLGVRSARAFLERRSDVGAVLLTRTGRLQFVGAVDVREVSHG